MSEDDKPQYIKLSKADEEWLSKEGPLQIHVVKYVNLSPIITESRDGNTIGKVTNVPAPGNAVSEANLPLKIENNAEKSWLAQGWDNIKWAGGKIADAAVWVVDNPLEATHWGLDGIGLVPGFGEIADGVNGVIYTIEGRSVEAGLSFAAMIPLAGWGATTAKTTYKVAGKEATEKVIKETAQKKAEKESAEKGAKVKGKTKGPCDHLKKGSGNGKYRGGAHGKTKDHGDRNKSLDSDGKKIIKQESHHAPAHDSSPLSKDDGFAIQMDKIDHNKTSSHGTKGRAAREYRKLLKNLIDKGEWRKAMAIEIKDIRNIAKNSGDRFKYDEAITEMLDYFKCLKANNLI